MFIVHLITLRQQGNILKTSQPEKQSIAEPRMRAENLRVMIQGDRGTGKQTEQQKILIFWCSDTAEKRRGNTDNRNWHREIDNKVKGLEKTALRWPKQYLACNHLNLNDYFDVLPDRRTQKSMIWCSQAILKGQSHQQVRKKSYHRDWPMRSSGNLGWFLFPCSFYWCFLWSLYLHSSSSERVLMKTSYN